MEKGKEKRENELLDYHCKEVIGNEVKEIKKGKRLWEQLNTL